MTKQSDIVERLEALHKIDGRMIVCMERSDIAEAAQTITDQAALIDELVGALKPFIGDPATFPTMELMQTTHGRNVLTKVEQWKG